MAGRSNSSVALAHCQVELLRRVNDAAGGLPTTGLRGVDVVKLMTEGYLHCSEAALRITPAGAAHLRRYDRSS